MHPFPLRFEVLSITIRRISQVCFGLLLDSLLGLTDVFILMTSYLPDSLATFQPLSFSSLICSVGSLRSEIPQGMVLFILFFFKQMGLLRCWVKGSGRGLVTRCLGAGPPPLLLWHRRLPPASMSICFPFLSCFPALLMMVFLRLLSSFLFSCYFIIHDIFSCVFATLSGYPQISN